MQFIEMNRGKDFIKDYKPVFCVWFLHVALLFTSTKQRCIIYLINIRLNETVTLELEAIHYCKT